MTIKSIYLTFAIAIALFTRNAIADWDLTVSVNGTGSVSSSPLGISTSTSQTFTFLSGVTQVTLTATGQALTAASGNYTITEGDGLALVGSSSLAGSSFNNWTGPDAPPPGPGNPDKVNPYAVNSDGVTNKSVSANFTSLSITSFSWVLGTGSGNPNFAVPGSSATPSVSWAQLAGAGFSAGNYTGRLTVDNGTSTNSKDFSLTINPLNSNAVPEPGSILLLSTTGVFFSLASKRSRRKLLTLLGRK